MSKTTKLLLGVTTLLTLAYTIFLFVSLALHFSSLLFGPPERNIFLEWFDTLFVVNVVAMLGNVALMAFYVAHIVKSPWLRSELKAIWVAVVLVGSVFAMPVYWYLYVWRERDAPLPAASG